MSVKEIKTPDLGGAAEVTVIEILVKPGDKVATDDPIVTLESDKATMEVPTSDAGVVKEVKVKVGDDVGAGDVLIIIDAEGSDTGSDPSDENVNKGSGTGSDPKTKEVDSAEVESEEPAKNKSKGSGTGSDPSDENVNKGSGTGSDPSGQSADIHAGPAVRRMAREMGVELKHVSGTGQKGRITREDVEQYVKKQLSQPRGGGLPFESPPAIDFSKFGPTSSQPLSKIKKLTGKFLSRNWLMIPHVTQFDEADITNLEAFRQSQKGDLAKQGIKLTPLVFIMKAVVSALKAYPQFNASLDAKGENLILKNYYHIGVAVDTPNGLVVPVIRDVDKKGLVDLAKELGEVSQKARDGKLLPGDMQGGCFSISSLGGIGGTAFTPIINHPEVAILGVSRSAQKPIYKDGQFEPRLMLPLSLSYDHRVIDGADGARFIVHLGKLLSDIRNVLL